MFVHRPSKKGAYQAPDWLRSSFFCFIVPPLLAAPNAADWGAAAGSYQTRHQPTGLIVYSTKLFRGKTCGFTERAYLSVDLKVNCEIERYN
jgi:hypothetical protein